MDPTTRRRIGRTKLEVSVFGFGAAPIGGSHATISEAQASATVEAAAIQFPLAHPAVAAVIPGALSPAEVHANAGLLRRQVPAALWQELRHERLLDANAPVPA